MDNAKLKSELAEIAKKLAAIARQFDAKAIAGAVQESSAEYAAPQGTCLACGEPILDGEAVDRGDHHRCYRAILRDIKEGLYDDQTAVDLGLWLAAESGGRKKKSQATGFSQRREEARRLFEEKAKAGQKAKALPPPE